MLLRIFYTLTTVIIGIITLLVFSGCGSLAGYGNILHGPTQEIPIFSEPEGATAEIDGNMRVMTPNVVTLKRRSRHQIKIDKDEYKTFLSSVNKEISLAMILDINYYFIGLIPDLIVGGGYNLSPRVVNAMLQKEEGVVEEPGNGEIPMEYPILPIEDVKHGKHPEVIINTISKRGIIGKLWELQDNSILIQPLSWREEPALIELNAISQITLRKKCYSRSSFINGAIIGFLANTFVTTPILSSDDRDLVPAIFIVGGIIGAWIGAEIGGTIGFLADLSRKVYNPEIDFSVLSEQQKVMKIEKLLNYDQAKER